MESRAATNVRTFEYQGSPQSRHCRHFAGWRLALPAKTKIWSLFAGWKVLLVFVFACWRSSCLSKTAQRVGTLSFPFFFLLKHATERSSSCFKAHLLSLSVRVGQLRSTITKAASMRVKSRASDAECPEALPVYSVLHVAALHALTIAVSQLVAE